MEKMLEQLYKGELYPYSKFQTTIEDFKVNRDKAFKSYSVFIEKLPVPALFCSPPDRIHPHIVKQGGYEGNKQGGDKGCRHDRNRGHPMVFQIFPGILFPYHIRPPCLPLGASETIRPSSRRMMRSA